MAIKLPDPGNGIPEQKTGNDEWTNMKIVRDNFADQSNAASRLVGTNTGNLLEAGAFGFGGASPNRSYNTSDEQANAAITKGQFWSANNNSTSPIGMQASYGLAIPFVGGADYGAYIGLTAASKKIAVKWYISKKWESGVTEFYTTSNTTTDVNKNIKSSSPVLQVFKDGVKKIHEANELPIKFTRNGVGDYTIEGTTGLRENDWQIVIPKDDHDNQMIAFTMKDDSGTIHLKTYKRTFSMETFLFGPDLSTPVDIPDGLWVDLHFNDLPQEQLAR